VAVLIAVAGIIGSLVIRDLVVAASDSAKIAYGHILGRIARYVILAITFLIAVDQIGIDIQFLSILVVLVIAAMLLGAALAFGMGAKDSVNNILSSYYLQKIYEVGQKVSIGKAEGRIIEITQTAVVLETAEGQILVPSKVFFEKASILIKEDG
jgi:small-conductance mechanosensitive channel